MKSTVTQRAAFDALAGAPRQTARAKILELFASTEVKLTRAEIAERATVSLQSVCGRVRELLDDAQLAVRGTIKRQGHRTEEELIGRPLEGV